MKNYIAVESILKINNEITLRDLAYMLPKLNYNTIKTYYYKIKGKNSRVIPDNLEN